MIHNELRADWWQDITHDDIDRMPVRHSIAARWMHDTGHALATPSLYEHDSNARRVYLRRNKTVELTNYNRQNLAVLLAYSERVFVWCYSDLSKVAYLKFAPHWSEVLIDDYKSIIKDYKSDMRSDEKPDYYLYRLKIYSLMEEHEGWLAA